MRWKQSVSWLGEQQQALWSCSPLSCDVEYRSMCCTLVPFNSSPLWEDVQQLLHGPFNSSLGQDSLNLQGQLHEQTVQSPEEAHKAMLVHCQLDHWLNSQNWFLGLDLGIWILIGLGMLFLLCFLEVLKALDYLFHRTLHAGAPG